MNDKINLLKALAIMLVVSGHLEFSLIPMFPPYSFQLALFFFISGMLFNDNYGFIEYFKRRFKSLIVPYFLYSLVYLGITIAIIPIIGKFWGMPINWYNELVIPFLTGHQLDLTSPLWFVPQLFITLIIYKLFKLKTWMYFVLAIIAIQFAPFRENLYILLALRTMFSLLFVHLGQLFKEKQGVNVNLVEKRLPVEIKQGVNVNLVEERLPVEIKQANIFTPKILSYIIILQSLLWLTNKDFTPADGVGLSYILVWGEFDNPIVPIITSLTGIYISLFIIEISYNYLKNCSFLQKIGQNTYHIMANHLLVFNVITYTILWFKGIPFDIKNEADIYWFYCPLKTTYFYFLAGIIITTYLGEFLKYGKRKIVKSLSNLI